MAEENKEKLKYLKREEIRTMAKDIKRLREMEAEEERRRIAALMAGKKEAKQKIKILPKKIEKERVKKVKAEKPEEKQLIMKLTEIQEEFNNILQKKKDLEIKRNLLLKQLDQNQKKLEPISKREKEIEEEELEIEKKEKSIIEAEEKRKVERKRWELEEEREKIEKERWEIEENIKKINAEIKNCERNYQEFLKKEKEISSEKEKLEKRVKKFKLEKELKEILEKKKPYEIEVTKFNTKIAKINQVLVKVSLQENEIERKIADLERKERAAKNLAEKEKIEKARHALAEKRRELEEKRWALEEEKNKINLQKEDFSKNYREMLEREKQIRKELAEIKSFLGEEAIKPEKKEIEKKEEKKVIPEKKKLRIEIPPKKIVLPKLPPKKPSSLKRILIRIGVVLLLLLAGLLYWYFEISKPPPEEITPKAEEKVEISVPSPLIPVDSSRDFKVSKNEEIPSIFNQIIKERFGEDTLNRIVIKNLKEGQLVSLEDLSQIFQTDVPKEIFNKIEKDYTLSIFAQKEGNRIVLIAKIKEKEGLDNLLKEWRERISREGVSLLGQNFPALSSSFATGTIKGVEFHYLTISEEDFGVYYLLFNDYFIFTTSFRALERVMESLEKVSLEDRIGQLFIIGFEEREVTPRLEEILKKYKPGGVLLLSKNIESREQLKKLISDLQKISIRETGFPLFIAVDQEGEPISRVEFLTEKTSQSDIKTPEEAYQIGLNRGKELKELGINLNLAPLLDDMQNGDFYFNRSFQKSPETIGELAKSLILGQKDAGILVAIKHFPGYCNIPFNPENKLAAVNLPEISQFKKAMEAKPEFVIASNVIYKEIDPSLPFTFTKKGIQFLRNNLGEEVIIVSDDLSQYSLLENFTLKDIITKPIKSGVDILIFSGYRTPVEKGLNEFLKAFKNGEISKITVEEAISKIIQLKKEIKI